MKYYSLLIFILWSCQTDNITQLGLIPYRNGETWGYVNSEGKTIIPFLYEDAGIFSEGLAWVKKDGKYGYIDTTGKPIIPFQYINAGDVEKGMARVYSNESTFQINTNGKPPLVGACGNVFIPRWNTTIIKSGKKYGVVSPLDSPNGNYEDTLIQPIYDKIRNCFDTNYYVANINSHWCLFNSKGIKLSKNYKKLSCPAYGFAHFESNGKYGLIDTLGYEIAPAIYDSIGSFMDIYTGNEIELCIVKKNNKWGYVNKKGKEICEIKYSKVLNAKSGLARVQLNGNWGYIDEKGKEYFKD